MARRRLNGVQPTPELLAEKGLWITDIPGNGEYRSVRLSLASYKDWTGETVYFSARYEVAIVGGYGQRFQLIETLDANEAIEMYATCVAMVVMGVDVGEMLVQRYALHPPVKVTPPSADR